MLTFVKFVFHYMISELNLHTVLLSKQLHINLHNQN